MSAHTCLKTIFWNRVLGEEPNSVCVTVKSKKDKFEQRGEDFTILKTGEEAQFGCGASLLRANIYLRLSVYLHSSSTDP